MKKVLEICVDSYASAMAAIAGGADRLELCSALSVGGLTPSFALLEQIRQESDIAVRCLMRPRAGDFLYTRQEIQQMAQEITQLRQAGADGFVIGCLDAEGNLDCGAMQPLLEAAQGTGLTLHRCIDVSQDLLQTYRDAAALGIDTILTSGGSCCCTAGLETIRALLALRDQLQGPEILVGAGVNAKVITAFQQALPGVRAFHMSGKTEVESAMAFRREGIPMGLPGLDEWHIPQTSQQAVQAARAALDQPEQEENKA